MNIIKRAIEPSLIKLAKSYPVVTVMGPRQAGKTVLVQDAFPNKEYINLETPDIREFAELDPRSFLEKLPNGAILDEIQRVPKLLSYIQAIVDQKNKKGLFILTGSHQFELHQAISQSLAGRTALLKLLPLSLSELKNAGIKMSLDKQMLTGCFPRIYKDKLDPTQAYRNYFQTYIERDLRQLINVKDLSQFQKFMKLCAGRVGQVVNTNSLSNEVGVSHHTIKAWLSLLEASFIIFQLQPYFENVSKRIVKSPKIYFTDVGLATYLLDIETPEQLSRDPLRGGIFENLVILELLKHQLNQGKEPHFYFYRDQNQNEVDVIYKQASKLIPIEIKSSQTIHPDFFKGIKFLKNLLPERCESGCVIYAGSREQHVDDINILNYLNAEEIFKFN